jgi:hypothetical protein
MSDDVQTDSATDTTADESQPDAETVDTEGAEGAEPDQFPREYVERLRRESAGYRDKAKGSDERADTLAQRLHAELVSATGRLQDTRDLPYDPAHLESAEALSGAIDALLEERPHLKSRKVTGDVGQGKRGEAGEVSLVELLRARV